MGISENDTPCSKTIHIGGKRLWMPLKTADPVVQVIYRNKKNVWAPGAQGRRQNQRKNKGNRKTHDKNRNGFSVSPAGNQTHVLIFRIIFCTGIDRAASDGLIPTPHQCEYARHL
tara:strand:+ start:302 stop:646 length:345 start_codon:yes stop_codon:yes gene_type:complete